MVVFFDVHSSPSFSPSPFVLLLLPPLMLLLSCRPRLGIDTFLSLLSVHEGENKNTFMTCSLFETSPLMGVSQALSLIVSCQHRTLSVLRSFINAISFYSCHLVPVAFVACASFNPSFFKILIEGCSTASLVSGSLFLSFRANPSRDLFAEINFMVHGFVSN